MEVKFTSNPRPEFTLGQLIEEGARRSSDDQSYPSTFLFDGYVYALIALNATGRNIQCGGDSRACINLKSQTVRFVPLHAPIEPVKVDVVVHSTKTHRYQNAS